MSRAILRGYCLVSNYSAPSEWGDRMEEAHKLESGQLEEFPIIPPQVNGATPSGGIHAFLLSHSITVSNYSAPSEWGDIDTKIKDLDSVQVSNYSAPSEWGDTFYCY